MTDKKFLENLGNRIKTTREKQGISLYALEEKAGIKRSTIMRIEKATSTPTIISLKKIAEALEINLGELVQIENV